MKLARVLVPALLAVASAALYIAPSAAAAAPSAAAAHHLLPPHQMQARRWCRRPRQSAERPINQWSAAWWQYRSPKASAHKPLNRLDGGQVQARAVRAGVLPGRTTDLRPGQPD